MMVLSMSSAESIFLSFNSLNLNSARFATCAVGAWYGDVMDISCAETIAQMKKRPTVRKDECAEPTALLGGHEHEAFELMKHVREC